MHVWPWECSRVPIDGSTDILLENFCWFRLGAVTTPCIITRESLEGGWGQTLALGVPQTFFSTFTSIVFIPSTPSALPPSPPLLLPPPPLGLTTGA